MNDVAAREWSRACRTVRSARKLLEEDAESAVSRAYYAAFHALTALFALRGASFSKHTALRAALHRDLIHSGEWPQELGRVYDSLMDMRDAADYQTEVEVSSDLAEQALAYAEQILVQVRQSCPTFPEPT